MPMTGLAWLLEKQMHGHGSWLPIKCIQFASENAGDEAIR